ncbi:uncharacterized protein F4822DRAFT_318294 [Hypoxylon trugodes]|uniref:uncharacterized protein n=1 Tax=Hypoxylon trugodes TaxID=326681 RepID=UPI00219C3086|nr:uncharacterized protein F4822DRAFT_318294 [Hypoxylon trugodes]KAI1386497.1 hypothetical protein F4822DRAFT_318294 [Hypoxylon trugodes]
MSGNWTSPAPKVSGPQVSGHDHRHFRNSYAKLAYQTAKPKGPPYPSTMAIVGGEPSPSVDDPIAAILLLLFLLSAAAHMAILRVNKQRNLKFIFSGMLFVLCILRGVSLAARMVWASYPKTVNAVIAASVMTQCGSVLIFIINLFFAQRILRAYHPRLGWHRGTCYVVWFLIACVLCCLIMAIAATVHGFFTLNPRARRSDRAVQLFAGTYLACLAFLPVPVVAIAAAVGATPSVSSSSSSESPYPRRTGWARWWNFQRRQRRVEKFGAGRWRAKVGLLTFASLVATLGAAFRVGVNFDGRPGSDPAWFHSRACYYGFNFVTDLIVSTAYLLARFDRRFVVPDGAKGPGDYSPIVPQTPMSATNSRCNLVSKLPMMGTSKPLTMMRQPSGSSPIPPPGAGTASIPPTPSPHPQLISPSTSQQHLNTGYDSNHNTDSSNTAVNNSPTTSSSLNRKKVHRQLPPHQAPTPTPSPPQRPDSGLSDPNANIDEKSPTSPSTTPTPPPTTKPQQKRTSRSRRTALMMRMRINSEADVYGPDCNRSLRPHFFSHAQQSTPSHPNPTEPAQAHLGPPILPDLDLDLELLSTTLLAPWALDNWGFRRSMSQGVIGLGGRGGHGIGIGTGSGDAGLLDASFRLFKNGGGSTRGGRSNRSHSDEGRSDKVSRNSRSSNDSNGSGGGVGGSNDDGGGNRSKSDGGSDHENSRNDSNYAFSQRSARARTM